MYSLSLHNIFDLLTSIAYFTIPIGLLVFLKKRKDLDFKWLFMCFGLFIMLCGLSHSMHIIVYLNPSHSVHMIDIIVRGLMAFVSILTAISLWWILPKAFLMPSPSQLALANKKLNERTEELYQSNELLKQEIVKHKHTTKKLTHLTAIMQSSDDAIIGVTLEGKISSWNLGASGIFGFDDEEIVGESYDRLVSSDQVAQIKELFLKVSKGERVLHHEMEHIQNNGSTIDGSLTLSPVRSDESDEIIGVSVILRDITSTNRLQEEMNRLARLHIVGELAASVAHEIRNPMTVIRGFVQLYSKEIEKSSKSHGKIILEELDRTESIINTYLSLAKPQMEKIGEINLKAEILKILEVMMSYANYQVVEIIHDLEDELFVQANKEKFSQMMVNMIKNGIEAMPNGGTLTIKAYRTGDGINLDILDTGVGMTPEEIRRLGSPFYSTKEKGTGLGTMMIYKILDSFQWKLDIESEKGVGSRFRILIHP